MRSSSTAAWAMMLAGAAFLAVTPAPAQDKPWWPVKVYDATSGDNVVIDYRPLERASKPWNICVLFPTMKDSFWIAVAYGLVTEAERQGVNMTLHDAGGYTNLSQQLAQFDACMTAGVDAIIIGPITAAPFAERLKQGMAAGKPMIVTANPVPEADVTAEMYVDYATMSELAGKYLLTSVGDASTQVLAFPGPADSGWAERYLEGFTGAINGSNVVLLDAMYGDTGVGDQAKLVEDALQTYPMVDVIWGAAPAAQAAMEARAETGSDFKIIAAYENEAMREALDRGEILGFATEYPVLEGKVAIDMAVRALEGAPLIKFARPIPDMVSKENIERIDMELVLAPVDWTPVYAVQQ